MAASAEETAALLGRVPVFEALRPEDLARVADVAVPRKLRGGEVVFRENDDSDTCYVVRSGHARAVREHADGRQITLATFGPGDIFGELAMFDDELREHGRDAALHGLERLARVALVGRPQAPAERDHELDRDLGVARQQRAHVDARDAEHVERVDRLDGGRAALVVEHRQLAEDVARAERGEGDLAAVGVLADGAGVAGAHDVAGV